MSHGNNEKASFLEIIKSCIQPRALRMLLFGFSAGLPLLLIFSTLSVWLSEAGVSRSAVTFFSWAALAYSFKFIWAPLIDLLPLPFLSKSLGKRRGWLFLAQTMILVAILFMAFIDPAQGQNALAMMACAAILLGFSSATQDIVIDAYRIEIAEPRLQALLASMYIAGYRVGMLVAGAGSLYLASLFGTAADDYQYIAWQKAYFCMAAAMSIGLLTCLFSPEPQVKEGDEREFSKGQYFRFFLIFLTVVVSFVAVFFGGGKLLDTIETRSHLLSFLLEIVRLVLALGVAFVVARILSRFKIVPRELLEKSYISPVREFFNRFGLRHALLILALVGCYRISDIVLGVISNVFYLDMGYSKNVIATVTKTFGLSMTLLGGFLGGVLSLRFGVYRTLLLGAILVVITNLLFVGLVRVGGGLHALIIVIGADNLCGGIASTAFVAFLSSITNVSFTAVQYAIFSSLMTLLPKFLGGYSGTMVSAFGYENFFLFSSALGLPVIILVLFVMRVFANVRS